MSQVARYALVGIANTATDWLIFFCLVWVGLLPAIANVVGWAASIIGAYAMNARYTFGAERLAASSFIGFVVVAVTGLALSTLALVTAQHAVPIVAAKAIATIVSFTTTFSLNRLWTFKSPKRL